MSQPVPPNLSVVRLATEAADLLRAAGTAPQGGRPGLLHTAEAAETVAALAGIAARLPELLDQVEAFLSSEQASGRIAPATEPVGDAAFDVIRAARDARDQLYEASRTAALLAEVLAAAAGTLAPLGGSRTAGGPLTPHV
ncbi:MULTISPECIES: hypothetical protein [unclassified Streptomyces]|uniref:hypothetical protein n=1 Tax=Streptomycetaceae TaxID=2062 RepID=UPI002E77BF1E|nr:MULTISPECIES: hypothetical protein [unclassified Streptomyces]MED7952058.1 hypothetical protein [Streptomyces sp. BE303]MEE1822416.1 hypothetical protein [Streptomyces sp. BE20]